MTSKEKFEDFPVLNIHVLKTNWAAKIKLASPPDGEWAPSVSFRFTIRESFRY
jgi:hypothetical protein